MMVALIYAGLVLALLPFQGVTWVIQTIKQPVPAVRGVVVDPSGAPINGALVEVFDHPEVRFISGPDEDKEIKQHKLAEFKTGPDGKFKFPNLAAGKYELRCTGVQYFNTLSAIVTLKPKRTKHPSNGIVLKLSLST